MNRKRLKISGILFFVVITIFYITSDMKKEPILAKQNQKIVLNEGTEQEFTVPEDATKLIEPNLISRTPLFDNYIQSVPNTPSIIKNFTQTFTSEIVKGIDGQKHALDWSIVDVQKTKNNNYFVLYKIFGPNSAGVTRAAVFDEQGTELASSQIGVLTDVNYRVNGKILSFGSNSFLLTTSRSYLRFVVSDDNSSQVSISFTELDVENGSTSIETALRVHTPKIIKGTDGNSLYTGLTFFQNSGNISGLVAGKLGVGEAEFLNWEQSGSVKINSNFQYYLDNPTFKDLAIPFNINYVTSENFFRNSREDIYAPISYVNNTEEQLKTYHTFQIFNTMEQGEKGYQKKKLEYIYHDSYVENIILLEELTTDEEIYFFSQEKVNSKLIKVDLKNGYKDTVVKYYPPHTILNFIKKGTSYSFFGSTSQLTGELQSSFYPNDSEHHNYFVQGVLDKDFRKISLNALKTEGMVIPQHIKISDNTIFVAGQTYDFKSFTNQLSIMQADGSIVSITSNKISDNGAFVGTLNVNDDYSPVISNFSNSFPNAGKIVVNKSKQELKSTTVNELGWTPLDNYLITGAIDGTIQSDKSIKVYDNHDIAVLNHDINQFHSQINRNSKTKKDENGIISYAAIDWKALGFDKEKTGPQNVTYFITDSQSQATSTSRWVDTITNQTIKEGIREKDGQEIKEEVNAYFDAQNFAIPIDTVKDDIPDEETFKKLAETMIWNEVTHDIYEDGKNQKFSNKVTVNQQQLTDLRNANEKDGGGAKPYPVDITFEAVINSGSISSGGNEDVPMPPGSEVGGGGPVGSGPVTHKMTNRVWVFVTTKNTVVDKDTGIVIYSDDYSLRLQDAESESMDEVYKNGNVKAYDYYDYQHEDVNPLPPLADKDNPVGLKIENLEVITDAQKPGKVVPKISYKKDENNKPTTTTPTVTIYAELLVHTRQIILNKSAELPVLSKGYLKMIYGSSHEANLRINSGIDIQTLAYTTSVVDFNNVTDGNTVSFHLIVPEYYRYKGYTLSTDEATDHQTLPLTEGEYKYNFNKAAYEIWLTHYIEPNQPASPKPYSWAYQNDYFGNLKLP